MAIPIIDEKEILKRVMAQKNPFFPQYYAFYSSWFGGIIKNPHLMLLPIDDHMVHRGDGVFEAMKAVSSHVYLLAEHIERLLRSAEKIALNHLYTRQQIADLILETLHASEQTQASVRVFLSRGPGNFSANPYDSIEPQLYIVVAQLNEPPLRQYQQGVVIGQSIIECKSSLMAQIKSCNYLPNVLMKKEAVDRQLDFVIGVDTHGFITESATENVMIVDQHGVITHPVLDYILKGTTMVRVCELAREHGFTTEMRSITVSDLISAREVMITGTSVNVLPVVKFENNTIGQGTPGMVAKKLNVLLFDDIQRSRRV